MHAKPDSPLGSKSHRDANSLVLQLAQSASDDGVGSCATYWPGTQVLTGVHVALFTSELKVPAKYKPRNHRTTVSCVPTTPHSLFDRRTLGPIYHNA